MMMRTFSSAAFLALLLVATACGPDVPLQPSSLFGDHMVLQADAPIPVWGTAAPNKKVTVVFRDQKVTVRADDRGNWKLTLAAEPYGDGLEGETLTITSGGQDVVLSGVLVGEVWVCSGNPIWKCPWSATGRS
ncbi:MAG: hypothetical protein R2751_13595 [Bacteroidales bacterium]